MLPTVESTDHNPQIRFLPSTPTSTPCTFQMASFEEIDRRLTRDFNAAVELLQQDEFEKCNDALRNLLADSDISRYYRIRCYTMLAGGLDDFHEAYAFYVKGESLWRLTEAWFRVFPTPAAKQTLDDLRECLEEIRSVSSILFGGRN